MKKKGEKENHSNRFECQKGLQGSDQPLGEEKSKLAQGEVAIQKYLLPPRKVANAVCLNCKRCIRLDSSLDKSACPSCGVSLDVHESTGYYDYLLQREKDEIREVTENMTAGEYYVKKFGYYWRHSLPMHAICIPIIAVTLLLYQFVPEIYEFPVIIFAGTIAVIVEFGWLFWLIMPVTIAGIHETIARDELYGIRIKSKYKKLQVALVVLGLLIIVGHYGPVIASAITTEPAKKEWLYDGSGGYIQNGTKYIPYEQPNGETRYRPIPTLPTHQKLTPPSPESIAATEEALAENESAESKPSNLLEKTPWSQQLSSRQG